MGKMITLVVLSVAFLVLAVSDTIKKIKEKGTTDHIAQK